MTAIIEKFEWDSADGLARVAGAAGLSFCITGIYGCTLGLTSQNPIAAGAVLAAHVQHGLKWNAGDY